MRKYPFPSSCKPSPQYSWDFPEEIPEKIWKDPGNALRAFPGIPSRVWLGSPKPYNSMHPRPPEHFQKPHPLSTAGDASFSEMVLERASQSWSWNSSSTEGISDHSKKTNFGFRFFCRFQGTSGFSFRKSGFSFWFQFWPKRRGRWNQCINHLPAFFLCNELGPSQAILGNLLRPFSGDSR